jgi:hypothetical protein
MTKKEKLKKELEKITERIGKLYLLQRALQTELHSHLSKTTYFVCGTGSDTALLPDIYHNKVKGCSKKTSLAKLYLYDRREYIQPPYPTLGGFTHQEYFIICPKCGCINRFFDRDDYKILGDKSLFKKVKDINLAWEDITEEVIYLGLHKKEENDF